jgi:hypothetical protein
VPIVFVVLLYDKLHLPPPTVRRIWRALAADTAPDVVALRYHLGAVDRRLWRDEDLPGAVVALMDGPAAPRRLLPVLERYVEHGKLRRRDVNDLEEGILRDTGRNGQWL